MENASKALIMAGSVLIAMIVISLLVIFFGNLRGLQQTELTAEQIEKMEDYNKHYEPYLRNIYGSELFSLANRIDDYNKRKAEIDDYSKIELEVAISDDIDGEYFKKGTYSTKKLVDTMNALNSRVEEENVFNKNNLYKSLVTEIKSRTFKYKDVEYDSITGKISKIYYEI